MQSDCCQHKGAPESLCLALGRDDSVSAPHLPQLIAQRMCEVSRMDLILSRLEPKNRAGLLYEFVHFVCLPGLDATTPQHTATKNSELTVVVCLKQFAVQIEKVPEPTISIFFPSMVIGFGVIFHHTSVPPVIVVADASNNCFSASSRGWTVLTAIEKSKNTTLTLLCGFSRCEQALCRRQMASHIFNVFFVFQHILQIC